MEKLRNAFSHTGLGESDLEQVCSMFGSRQFDKNEYLLKAGQVATKLFFIESGSFLLGQELEEQSVTRHLVKEGEFITCLESFSRQSITTEFLKATDQSLAYFISRNDFDKALRQYPVLEKFYQQLIFQTLLNCQQRITDLISLDAKAYYKEIMHRYPDFLQRMPQYDLASFMGIEPQSLSRIRKES